ncbi:hypothetical protein OFC05_31000, partial [Escherichia coli]|nr:hypothetical protein [Escherichia coli]
MSLALLSLHTPKSETTAMRTLTLLTTLLLLALHTQAESPQGSTKEAPDEEQDISVFFGGDKGTALQYAAVKAGVTCSC